mmetsp:Transcript_41730/g.120563  ORF Transcript_41730/g.120563 Transcript_41730/m.120563 type:complete len:1127 (-) Transcript_41730:46-3426(-)
MVPKAKKQQGPAWFGEAWARDDGLVLNLPVFNGCGPKFKRLLLRAIRFYEYEDHGRETWFDFDNDEICTLETLPAERLPPLLQKTLGQKLDPGDYICKGGDYDARLVVVLSGTVEKLVGDSPQGGKLVVRRLARGDCEGLPEFLGVGGTQQRTCALRAAGDGAHVRYVTREAIVSLMKQTVPAEDEDDEPVPRWPDEIAWFQSLAIDRIDALPHKAAKELLSFAPLTGAKKLDFMSLEGQSIFVIDNALGLSVSGPLPEGIEERYYFDGQTVISPGAQGDSLVMILRGEAEALVPAGCGGKCLPRTYKTTRSGSWLGDGRCPSPAPVDQGSAQAAPEVPKKLDPIEELRMQKNSVVMYTALVKPTDIKRARRKLSAAAEAGRLDLSDQKTTDWRWSWDDPKALVVLDILEENRLLSAYGEERADEVRLHQNPPKLPPPPEPQAILKSGTQVGHLALLGVPVVFSGVIRAKGPLHVVILHRHVLLEAIKDCPEVKIFQPNGVTPEDWVDYLSQPVIRKGEPGARPAHLGPNTGPPPHTTKEEAAEPKAGTYEAWKSESGQFGGMPGADALDLVLLNAIKDYALLWDLIHDAPPAVLEKVVSKFEPRWLLPNERIIEDEEPNADFLFVVIHGKFVVMLEGAEIDHIGQGNIQGGAQLLTLNDWTRTVIVDPMNKGEAMIQVIRRSKLVECFDNQPTQQSRLRQVEEGLRDAKKADWRLLKNIPAFGNITERKFLQRVYKDADIRLYCPGDVLAEAGTPAPSLIVVLAGTLRSEQAQTLFFVELKRGDWCFQNNILGIDPERAHDVVAVTHAMVMVLYRHALLNAVVAHPAAREAVLDNETWRTDPEVPRLKSLKVFENVPDPVIARMEVEAAPRYYKQGSIVQAAGSFIEDDMLLFLLRGEVKVSILGIYIRHLKAGEAIGVLRYMDLDTPTSNVEIVATEACDVLAVRKSTMADALSEEKYEDDLAPYKNAQRVLGGGPILDAFGFPIGGGSKYRPDCIEKSEVLQACSETFVAQMPQLVEEIAFWPGEKLFSQGDVGHFMFFIKAGRVRLEVLGRKKHEVVGGGATIGDMACLEQVPYHTETAYAETHVWARVLHRKLIRRALASFPEEEKRLLGSASGGTGVFAD